MPYRMVKAASYKWPVKIQTPKGDGTEAYDEFDVTLEFRRVKRNELDGTVDEQLKALVCGWSGIQDETGADIKFSPGALEELMQDNFFVQSALKGYWKSIAGAQEKN